MPRKKSETTEEPKKKTTRTKSSSTVKKEKETIQLNEAENDVIASEPVNEVTSAADVNSVLKEATLPEVAPEAVSAVIAEANKEQNGNNNGNGYAKQHKHTHPKLGFNFLAQQTLAELTVMHDVLLIDDDIELCELLSHWLTQEGFQVRACHDGQQARENLALHSPEAVILDVMLPDGSGLELLSNCAATTLSYPC